jgi:hypothetical protein
MAIKIGEKKYQNFQKSIGTIKWYLSSRKRKPCGIKIFSDNFMKYTI